MKKVNFRLLMMLMGVLAISVMTSCSDDDNDKPVPKPEENTAKFLMVTTVKNTGGMTGSSYMKLVKDFSGKIDNSNSIGVGFGGAPAVRDNVIFDFPSWGKDSDNKLKKYTYTGSANLRTPTNLKLPANSSISNITIVNDTKAYLPAYSIGKVLIINPQTMKKTGVIDLSTYAYKDNTPDPSNGIMHKGLYYLCLDQVNAHFMPYKDHRQVDVLIIDPKTDKVVKMISETKSNLSFPTRPMDITKGMIFANEQGDIYIACVGEFGHNPTYLNNGFVCIPSGKKEFDSSKSWDISNTLIEGTSYKPSSIYNCRYIGNGKVVAYVGILELTDLDPNKAFMTRNAMAVFIDINAKKIKQIKGIPVTDGHSICIEKYKDLVILGSYGKDKIGFFSYDPKTEKVELMVETVGNPAFFHYFE